MLAALQETKKKVSPWKESGITRNFPKQTNREWKYWLSLYGVQKHIDLPTNYIPLFQQVKWLAEINIQVTANP